jgi:seryl-tRNA synthetase
MSITQTLKAAVTLDTDEMTRLAKRREIKRQLSKRKCIDQDLIQLRSEQSAIENRVSTLAVNHESEVAALRASMDALAGQMADGPSEKLQSKRTALQQQVVDKTKALEKAVADARNDLAAVRKMMKPLQDSLENMPVHEYALGRDDTANPELLVRAFVRQQRIKFLQSRLEHAKQWLTANSNELGKAKLPGPPTYNGPFLFDSPGKPDVAAVRLYERRVVRWQAEVSACQSELSEALAEADAEHRQMIEE